MRDWRIGYFISAPRDSQMIHFSRYEFNKYGGHDEYKIRGNKFATGGHAQVSWFDAPRTWECVPT